MITCENGRFCLQGEEFTCLMQVNKWGLLEQLYFGPTVAMGDAAAFQPDPGIGWGASMRQQTIT